MAVTVPITAELSSKKMVPMFVPDSKVSGPVSSTAGEVRQRPSTPPTHRRASREQASRIATYRDGVQPPRSVESDIYIPRGEFLAFSPPVVGDEEIREVVNTLRSDWLTTGPKTGQFEQDFAQYVGATGALALNSCTA